MLQNCNIYNIVSKYSNFLSYGFMILKMMIMCCLHAPELNFTTCSLCSIHDPLSTLETAVCSTVVLGITHLKEKIVHCYASLEQYI